MKKSFTFLILLFLVNTITMSSNAQSIDRDPTKKIKVEIKYYDDINHNNKKDPNETEIINTIPTIDKNYFYGDGIQADGYSDFINNKCFDIMPCIFEITPKFNTKYSFYGLKVSNNLEYDDLYKDDMQYFKLNGSHYVVNGWIGEKITFDIKPTTEALNFEVPLNKRLEDLKVNYFIDKNKNNKIDGDEKIGDGGFNIKLGYSKIIDNNYSSFVDKNLNVPINVINDFVPIKINNSYSPTGKYKVNFGLNENNNNDFVFSDNVIVNGVLRPSLKGISTKMNTVKEEIGIEFDL